MHRAAFIVIVAVVAHATCMSQAQAATWSRSYLVEYYEPAHYYGTKSAARDQPGTDCPKGINPDNDWPTLLTTPYRTRAEVIAALDPERVDERTRGPNGYSIYFLRGPNRENVYDTTHPSFSTCHWLL